MIGFDLQEVDRIQDAEKLLQKIALPSEREYIQKFKCDFKMRVASLWAVKEATFKALDLTEGEISYKEIELCHKESGRPFIALHGKALAQFEKLNGKGIDVSISHQKNVVGAVVVVLEPLPND